MKKSKQIQLVLITAALAGCASNDAPKDWSNGNNNTYLRSDTTAPYSRAYHYSGGTPWLWYYAFRPYGSFGYGSGYRHAGYYSGAINPRSNYGSNAYKSGISRGGFGASSSRVGG